MGKGKKKDAAASGAEEQPHECQHNEKSSQDKSSAHEDTRPAKKARSAIDDIFAKAKPAAAGDGDDGTKETKPSNSKTIPEAKQSAAKVSSTDRTYKP